MHGQKKRIAIMFAGALVCAHAQWLNYPTPGTPRTRDGKPNLSAPASRTAKGRPDLSGVWQTEPAPSGEFERLFGDVSFAVVPGYDFRSFSKYFFNVLAHFKPEEAPIRSEAAELFRKRGGKDNPVSRCLPLGIPSAEILSYAPYKIIQTPGLVVMLYEVDNTHRQVYTDGRKLPADPQPAWLGYSVGKWEGDTLVVDTAGFNDQSWLDVTGHPHSEALRIQERFRRRDFGHMEVQVTLDDPKTFTKPFTIKFNQLLIPDSDVLEYFCTENEKDRAHLASQ